MTTTPVPYVYSRFINRRHELEKYEKGREKWYIVYETQAHFSQWHMKQCQHKIRIEHNSSI